MTLAVNLQHAFEGFSLDVSFTAPPGLTVLYGSSGSGKSTIVNAIAGLLRPAAGRIALGDRLLLDTAAGIHLPAHRRRVGYVFQEARLFPHFTVRQNLHYGRWFAGAAARKDTADFADTVALLGLERLLERHPSKLSGGEKQRVALGRALLAKPALILADEPLSSLDAARKAEILPYFERLRDQAALPIVYVSHAAAEVARLATTVVAIQEGRLLAQGSAVEVLGDPAVAPLGARSLGALLVATVAAHHKDGLTELSAGNVPLFVPLIQQPLGTTVRLRIPAQEVMLSLTQPANISALNIIPGQVESIHQGSAPGALISVTTKAGPLLASLTQRSVLALGLTPGQPCYAIIKTAALTPEDTGA